MSFFSIGRADEIRGYGPDSVSDGYQGWLVYDIASCKQIYVVAISFAKEYSDTLCCYKNHDVCYEI